MGEAIIVFRGSNALIGVTGCLGQEQTNFPLIQALAAII